MNAREAYEALQNHPADDLDFWERHWEDVYRCLSRRKHSIILHAFEVGYLIGRLDEEAKMHHAQ